MPDSILNTRCAIVGGGPGGMMLGFLLARAGVNVVVLEKFPDFLRDFRGDTIHPSTMEILKDLGLLEEFLKLPHETLQKIKMQFDDLILTLADFSYLKTSIKCIAFMPQWDFLNFIASRAEQFNNFQLMMQTEVTDIIEKNGRVIGVQAISPEGSLTIYSDLVIGADGRHSTVKEKLGLISIDDGAPMDVLWFRVHKIINDPATPLIRFSQGRGLVLISRGDYWQCGYIIPKDGWTQIKNRELSGFQEEISEKAPFMQDRIKELKWDQIKLLSVEVSHLKQWCRPGVLCIGDAAHAMSPIGGVGINLAIQDAVAAANILTQALLSTDPISIDVLKAVQKRREFSIRLIQRLQILIQNKFIKKVLNNNEKISPPLFIRIINYFPFLRRIPSRLIGLGIRPEFVKRK